MHHLRHVCAAFCVLKARYPRLGIAGCASRVPPFFTEPIIHRICELLVKRVIWRDSIVLVRSALSFHYDATVPCRICKRHCGHSAMGSMNVARVAVINNNGELGLRCVVAKPLANISHVRMRELENFGEVSHDLGVNRASPCIIAPRAPEPEGRPRGGHAYPELNRRTKRSLIAGIGECGRWQ